MKFVFVMDPYETLNLETETSLLLMDELLARGHRVFWLGQEDIFLQHHIPMGLVAEVRAINPFEKEPSEQASLNDFDAVLTRIDPPFDQNYLHLTYIFDFLDESVVQFNPVKALRNFNEKMLPLRWPGFVPATLVTQNKQQILAFIAEHSNIVVKPLDDCSGRGVVKLSAQQSDLEQVLSASLLNAFGQPQVLQAQRFLPEVSEGDKRVYLVNGEPVGVVNRLPQKGNFLANIHQGARCEASDLSIRERHIIETIKPFLLEQGIFLVGLDFIGGYITEINITSPSAIRQINEVSGAEVHKLIVDGMLERLAGRHEVWCCGAPLRRVI